MNNPGNSFEGFTPRTQTFLSEVYARNSKDWYTRNKAVYEQCLLKPMKQLVLSLSGKIAEIDSFIETSPAVNRTITRLQRDTRFSKDKSLYKDRMWITFKRLSDDWKTRPAFFFELSPTEYRYGMGFFAASSQTMEAFRGALQEKRYAEQFVDTLSALPDDVVFEGESYKRKFNLQIAPELEAFAQRRNLYAVVNRQNDALLYDAALAVEISKTYQALGQLYCLLWEACVHSKDYVRATDEFFPIL